MWTHSWIAFSYPGGKPPYLRCFALPYIDKVLWWLVTDGSHFNSKRKCEECDWWIRGMYPEFERKTSNFPVICPVQWDPPVVCKSATFPHAGGVEFATKSAHFLDIKISTGIFRYLLIVEPYETEKEICWSARIFFNMEHTKTLSSLDQYLTFWLFWCVTPESYPWSAKAKGLDEACGKFCESPYHSCI